jgi:predicted nucleic acid-binding protein
MAIIVDTGPLYALADADDQYHRAVAKFVAATRETLIVPSPIIPEVCYLLGEYLGANAETEFLQSLIGQELLLEHFNTKDLQRAVDILKQYHDVGFGMVDATVMAMAERLKIQTVLTIDHRDFGMFRPKHCDAFRIVPE